MGVGMMKCCACLRWVRATAIAPALPPWHVIDLRMDQVQDGATICDDCCLQLRGLVLSGITIPKVERATRQPVTTVGWPCYNCSSLRDIDSIGPLAIPCCTTCRPTLIQIYQDCYDAIRLANGAT